MDGTALSRLEAQLEGAFRQLTKAARAADAGGAQSVAMDLDSIALEVHRVHESLAGDRRRLRRQLSFV